VPHSANTTHNATNGETRRARKRAALARVCVPQPRAAHHARRAVAVGGHPPVRARTTRAASSSPPSEPRPPTNTYGWNSRSTRLTNATPHKRARCPPSEGQKVSTHKPCCLRCPCPCLVARAPLQRPRRTPYARRLGRACLVRRVGDRRERRVLIRDLVDGGEEREFVL